MRTAIADVDVDREGGQESPMWISDGDGWGQHCEGRGREDQWREEMPKEAVHVRPGCSTMRPSPVLNALAGHVIGSTAKPERRFFGSGNPSPVNSCT